MSKSPEPSQTSPQKRTGVDKMHHRLSDLLRTSLFYDLMASETEWRSRDEADRQRQRERERKR
ncbi:MAG: hypothetical protein VX549_12540 [Pseudomonadota bacterium]|nr:hypothetical protein [Pseudomonadota bacterium]